MNRFFCLLTSLSVAFVCVDVHADTTASFVLPSGVSVSITEAPFDAKKVRISFCEEYKEVCFIDGKPPFGSFYDPPETYVKQIKVSFKKQSYILDSTQMFNAWGDRPLDAGSIRYFGGSCNGKKHCKFRGVFSDAAGAFAAEWLVIDGKPMRTVLTSSKDLISFIANRIDPVPYY